MNVPGAVPKFFLSSLLLCLLLLAPPAKRVDADSSAAKKLEFDVLTLKRSGLIFMSASGDLDGDGKTDLLLFHRPSKEAYEKFCSIYFQRRGKFSESQPVELRLGESVGAVEIADIDGDGTDDLCAFDGGGMVVFKLSGESSFESSRVLEFRNLLPSAARQIVEVNWIADVDSDGAVDVILPAADGLHLFVRKDGGFVEARIYGPPMRASVGAYGGQHRIVYRLPTLRFSDFDNDGHTDIGAFDLEEMNFFLTDGSHIPNRRVASPLVQKFTKDFIGATEFPDLNADGVPDAALVLVSQKKSFQSEALIYFGKKDFSYGDEPSNVYSGDTNVILPMFLDTDGDGKMEMLLQNINVGFSFFLNYFLRDRIKVDVELRKLGENGIYAEKPVVRGAIYVRVSDTGAEPARSVGDFNGDGLDDFAVGTAENRLAFFQSSRAKSLPLRPTFTLDVPAYGNMKTFDLNDDDRDDLVILYAQDDMSDTATVILSSGESSP